MPKKKSINVFIPTQSCDNFSYFSGGKVPRRPKCLGSLRVTAWGAGGNDPSGACFCGCQRCARWAVGRSQGGDSCAGATQSRVPPQVGGTKGEGLQRPQGQRVGVRAGMGKRLL